MKTFSKILVGIIIGMMSFVTSSCTKDDIYQKKIEGKWEITRVTEEEYENGELVYSGEAKEQVGFVLEFKSDGTLMAAIAGGQAFPTPASWRIEKRKLILKGIESDGNTEELSIDIIELNNSSMILASTYESNDGEVKLKEVVTVYFARK